MKKASISFFETQKLPKITVKQTLPIYHKESNVNSYLTSCLNYCDIMKENHPSVLDEICIYTKNETIELLSKYRIVIAINGNKKFLIKTLYDTMCKQGIIEDNLRFNSKLNAYHDIQTFFELYTISNFAKKQNFLIYICQNGEKRLDISTAHTRQSDADCYFLIYDSNIKEYFIKGLDVKFGTLKNYGRSNLYPVVINKTNNLKEIYNDLNLDEYFINKIQTIENVLNQLNKNTQTLLKSNFLNMKNNLFNPESSLIEKFSALNDFNKLLILSRSGIIYNAEFVHIFEHKQELKQIDTTILNNFIEQLYRHDAATLEQSQIRIASMIKRLGDLELNELLKKTKSRRDSRFIEMIKNDFNIE